MALVRPQDVPDKYRAEYISHPAVTPSKDPVLNSINPEDPTALPRDILKADMNSPLFIPFLYGQTEAGHQNIAPAYLQVCGLDPLRDEALIYERVLREEADVKTKLDLYPGLGHYFWTNFPHLQASRKFVQDTRDGVRWLLEEANR